MGVDNVTQIVLAAVSVFATLVSAFFSARLYGAMQTLRLEIAQGRAADKQEQREWINGSFMRAATVDAKLDALRASLSFDHKGG